MTIFSFWLLIRDTLICDPGKGEQTPQRRGPRHIDLYEYRDCYLEPPNHRMVGPGPSEPGENDSFFNQSLNWHVHIKHLSWAGLSEVGWLRPERFWKEPGGGEQTPWHMSAQQGSSSQRDANSWGAADLSSSLGLIHYSSLTQIPQGSNIRMEYAANESNALSVSPCPRLALSLWPLWRQLQVSGGLYGVAQGQWTPDPVSGKPALFTVLVYGGG